MGNSCVDGAKPNPTTCTCPPCRPRQCPSGRTQSETCNCVCKPRQCPKGREQDRDTCRCVRPSNPVDAGVPVDAGSPGDAGPPCPVPLTISLHPTSQSQQGGVFAATPFQCPDDAGSPDDTRPPCHVPPTVFPHPTSQSQPCPANVPDGSWSNGQTVLNCCPKDYTMDGSGMCGYQIPGCSGT
jgi:hypothetical protein